jgi:hypothetical protein
MLSFAFGKGHILPLPFLWEHTAQTQTYQLYLKKKVHCWTKTVKTGVNIDLKINIHIHFRSQILNLPFSRKYICWNDLPWHWNPCFPKPLKWEHKTLTNTLTRSYIRRGLQGCVTKTMAVIIRITLANIIQQNLHKTKNTKPTFTRNFPYFPEQAGF